MPRSRVLATLVALVGVSIAGCSKTSTSETVDTSGPLLVRAESVRLDTVRASVIVTGTVMPSPGADWTITAPESGRVAEITKLEGDVVKEGDVLVRFEVPSLQTELAMRQTETSQANVRFQAAKATATRLSGLFARGIASQRDNEDASRDLQDAEAAVRQAQSNKEATDLVASHLVVKARFAGVIAQRWHNVGDQVEPTTTDPVLRVIDPTRLEVVAPVPAASLPLITPGRAARIFNPTDGSLIDGTVLTMPLVADPPAPTSDVRVSLPKTVTLPAGTPVQLEILSDARSNVLVVPTSVVLRDGAANADAYVMVAGADGKAHRKSVQVGLVALDRTQILSGLTVGERVILPGPEPITDGASVSIQK